MDGLTPALADSPSPEVRVRHLRTLVGWILAAGLALYFFAPVRMLVLGVLASACVASTLHPLTRRLRGPQWLRAVLVGLLPVLVVAAVGFLTWKLLAGPIAEQVSAFPKMREDVNAMLARWSQLAGVPEPPTLTSIANEGFGALTGGQGSGKAVATVAGAVVSGFITVFFVLFGSMYLLADQGRSLVAPLRALLPPERKPQLDAAVRDLVPRLRGWLLATMLSMTVIGIASSLAYWLVGLKFAIPIGVLAGLSEIVPTIGPATAFVGALAFAIGQGAGIVLGVVIAYVAVQTLESYLVTPLVMKNAVHMPPIITLFSVVLWGQVLGAGGLLLAIPINLCIWSFVDHFVIRPRNSRHAISLEGGNP